MGIYHQCGPFARVGGAFGILLPGIGHGETGSPRLISPSGGLPVTRAPPAAFFINQNAAIQQDFYIPQSLVTRALGEKEKRVKFLLPAFSSRLMIFPTASQPPRSSDSPFRDRPSANSLVGACQAKVLGLKSFEPDMLFHVSFCFYHAASVGKTRSFEHLQAPGHRHPPAPREGSRDLDEVTTRPPCLTIIASHLAPRRSRFCAQASRRSDVQKLTKRIKMAIGENRPFSL